MTEAIVQPLKADIQKALRDPQYLETVCRECIDHKVPTLNHYHESDFNEMVPQYGHAVAHAIEHLSFHTESVKPLLHGEAVAVGMCVTAEVAKILGVCDQKTVDEHYDYISNAGLPIFVPSGLTVEAIQEKLCYDKHYVKKPTMGLVESIGHMYCQEDGTYGVEVDNDTIHKALLANIKRRENCNTYELLSEWLAENDKSALHHVKKSEVTPNHVIARDVLSQQTWSQLCTCCTN